jgi:uncharacterized protein (TIRG00374 family)
MPKTQRFNAWGLVKILLAISLFVLIISGVNLSDLTNLFRNVSPVWLIASFVVYFLMSMTKALQYYVLIGGRVTYPRMLYIVTVQNIVSNFIANSAGIASYLATLKVEDGIKFSRAAIVFVLTKAMDIFFIGLFLGVSSVILWSQIQDLQPVIILLLLGISLLVFSVIATLLFRKSFVSLVELVLRAFRVLKFPFIQRGMESLKALAEQEHKAVLQMVLQAFCLSFLYFFLVLVLSFITYRLFSIPFGMWVIIFVSCLLQLISLVPISVFGGLGVNEISLVYLYGFFGLPPTVIPAIAIGIRILSYLSGISGLWYLPAFAYFTHHQKPIDEAL